MTDNIEQGARVCPACGNRTTAGRPCRVCSHDPQVTDTRRPDQFDRYAAGEIGAWEITCVLCSHPGSCICPPFGSPAYLELIDARHGKSRGAQ